MSCTLGQSLRKRIFLEVKVQHLPELTAADTGCKTPCPVSFPVFQLHFKALKALENTPGQPKALVSSGSVHRDLHFLLSSMLNLTWIYLSASCSVHRKADVERKVSWRSTRNLPVRTPWALVPHKGLIWNHIRDGRKKYCLTSVGLWVAKVLL